MFVTENWQNYVAGIERSIQCQKEHTILMEYLMFIIENSFASVFETDKSIKILLKNISLPIHNFLG